MIDPEEIKSGEYAREMQNHLCSLFSNLFRGKRNGDIYIKAISSMQNGGLFDRLI